MLCTLLDGELELRCMEFGFRGLGFCGVDILDLGLRRALDCLSLKLRDTISEQRK
jgi:hypothetical protein